MWPAITLTIELAVVTTAVLVVVGVPLAWWLARNGSWVAEIVAAIVALPVVLPPTVMGFYLLILLGPNGPLAALLPFTGMRTLAFSFPGLVIGSIVYALPFMVQPARNAFQAVGNAPLEAAATLRASPRDTFFSVALPLAQGGILTGAILTFAHTIGEFGVVLMIGGDIPGKTEVLSIVIFNDVETMQWHSAFILSASMAGFAFIVIFITMLLERRSARQRA